MQPVGTWDQELFDDYRKARSRVKRRILLGRLLQQNMPLVKVLVDQFVQPSGKSKHGPNLLKGGTEGFTDIPWDDALQQASIAFCKAMDRFDPSKGKLAWYLKVKIRHELQDFMLRGGRTVRIPRKKGVDPVAVELTDDQGALDRWSGGELDGFASIEGITADDVERWDVTGEWPETLEEARPVPEDPRTALERFLEEQVRFRPAARVARDPLAARWERLTCAPYAETLRPALLGRGARDCSVRAPWDGSVVWGLAGVELLAAG